MRNLFSNNGGTNPPSVTNLMPMPMDDKLVIPGGLVLAEQAKAIMTPAQRGSMPYQQVALAVDESGSLGGYFKELQAAIAPMEVSLAENPLAKECIFCLSYTWAENVELIGAAAGKFVVPQRPPSLPGTNVPRLLSALRHDSLKFREHCSQQRVRHFDSLWLIVSDFQNCTPFQPGELQNHIDFIARDTTVISAMVGSFDREMAGMISNTPPVPANLVPLAELFSILGRSLSSSVSRPGSLKDIATAAITRKLRGAKQ